MSSMAETHTEDQWEALKDELRSLYLERGMALPAVSRLMEERHGFSARKNQYEKHFKRWKWSKNRSPEQWRQIDTVRRDRQMQGRDSVFYDRSRRIPQQQLDRSTRRYRHLGNYHQAPPPGLPSGITVSTPPAELDREETPLISNRTLIPEISQQLMFDLPFRLFETRLQHELGQSGGGRHQIQPSLPSSPLTVDPRLLMRGFSPSTICSTITPEKLSSSSDPRLVDSTTINDPSPGMSVATHVAFKIMDSILPLAFLESTSLNYVVDPDRGLLSTTQLRRTLFSLSNNLAGTVALSFGDSIRCLERDTGDALYRCIRGASDHTSRAIARTIFRGAVESGDASIVHLILNYNIASINPNDEVCIFENLKYTPIELASKLRHEKVIKVLLKYNVDIQKTFERGDPRFVPAGALECALGVTWRQDYVRLSPSIFKLLHDSGGVMREEWVWGLVHKKDAEFLRDVLSTHTQEHHKDWGQGIFHYALEILEEQECMKVIEDLVRVGANLNYRAIRDPIQLGRQTLIDSAATRGSSKLVQELLQRGTHITRDTLQFAIRSGNLNLIELLLDAGADVNSIGYDGNTPFAAAVRLGRPDVRNLITSRGGMSCIRENQHFAAVSQAASETWDIKLIEHLLEINLATNAKDLGKILVHAVRNEDEEVAKRLVDLGADLQVSYNDFAEDQTIKYGPPLSEALERRNSCLTHMLLQANAAPCLRPDPDTSISELAVRWGDQSIIKALLFAGASFGGIPFTVAVKQNDQELVGILLDSGVDINYSHLNNQNSALVASVENENINMARYLFSRGAEPHDQYALERCIHSSNREMLDLLLNEHARRYPYGRKGYGISALRHAVRFGQVDIVGMMLKKGADANKLEDNENYDGGWSNAFGEAIIMDQPQRTQLIEIFLSAHCDPNSIVSHLKIAVDQEPFPSIGIFRTTYARLTALLAAVGTQDVTVAELLIQHGANVNSPASGPVRRTPLQRAAETGSMEMVSLLLEHGAEVNAPPARDGGGTALQLAAIGGYIAIAWELMTKGADVNAKASVLNGRTALEGASEHGRLDMVAVLLKAGAAENGKDYAQLKRAIEFARENGHFHICEFIEDVAGQVLVEESELVDWDGQAAMAAT